MANKRQLSFKAGPFGHLLDLWRCDSANNAMHELMAQELIDDSFSEYKKVFNIGGRDIRFTSMDWVRIARSIFLFRGGFILDDVWLRIS